MLSFVYSTLEGSNIMAKNRPDFMTPETPPESKQGRKGESLVDWEAVERYARSRPNEWYRVHHEYKTDQSARFSAAKECRRRDLQVRTTVYGRQEDGRIGVFIRYPKGN